tara:strand:- start:6930 stop:7310 length:381 start_codon:yes stop_codon:yes gene_type:complete
MKITKADLNDNKKQGINIPSLALLLNKLLSDTSFIDLKYGDRIVTSTSASCVNNTGSVSQVEYVPATKGRSRTQYDLCEAIGGTNNTKGYFEGHYYIHTNDDTKKYLTNTNEFLTRNEIKNRNGEA